MEILKKMNYYTVIYSFFGGMLFIFTVTSLSLETENFIYMLFLIPFLIISIILFNVTYAPIEVFRNPIKLNSYKYYFYSENKLNAYFKYFFDVENSKQTIFNYMYFKNSSFILNTLKKINSDEEILSFVASSQVHFESNYFKNLDNDTQLKIADSVFIELLSKIDAKYDILDNALIDTSSNEDIKIDIPLPKLRKMLKNMLKNDKDKLELSAINPFELNYIMKEKNKTFEIEDPIQNFMGKIYHTNEKYI